MIEISLFVDGKFTSRMERLVVPSIGDTIVIDCGFMVKVIEISHQWNDPNDVQINCIEIDIKEDKEND